MSELFITFDPALGFWSPFIYWFVVINALACGLFMIVVIVGGLFDLRYLFKALSEEVDSSDDGRVRPETIPQPARPAVEPMTSTKPQPTEASATRTP
jgi:hypothetical protein